VSARPAPAREVAAQQLREPPHSIEAEQSVLGALLLDNSAWAVASGEIAEADFFRHEHRLIFAALRRLIEGGQPADAITVFEQLQNVGRADECGGLAHLNALAQSVPSAANIRRYAELVHERSTLRRVIAVSDVMASDAFQCKPPSGVLSRAVEALWQVERERCVQDGAVRLLGLQELREANGRIEWLVKNAIPKVSLGALFGAMGTFKSFVAADLGLHVAHGLRWLGRRTVKAPVIYIAAEGGSGLWGRVEAWHRERSLQWTEAPFYVVPTALDLSAEASRVVQAAKRLGVQPGLVVIDTLSQTLAGDENAADEMAGYLRNLGQQFRDLWNCAVLVLHHSGHSATERPRGSSAFGGNIDFLMGLHRDERQMLATLSCQKAKDWEPWADATFELRRVELGSDADGDPITSLMAWHLLSAGEIDSAVRAEAQAGRGGRDHALMALVDNGMEERNLRRAFYETLPQLDSDSRKKAYYRARDRAVKAGNIDLAEGFVIDLRRSR
jgi:hypothetical protein